jgi:hypothetical protein
MFLRGISIRRSAIKLRFDNARCDIKRDEWGCEDRLSLDSRVSSDSFLCKKVRYLFFDVIHHFLASRMSIFNHAHGREWLQSLKTSERIGDSLAGFE